MATEDLVLERRPVPDVVREPCPVGYTRRPVADVVLERCPFTYVVLERCPDLAFSNVIRIIKPCHLGPLQVARNGSPS